MAKTQLVGKGPSGSKGYRFYPKGPQRTRSFIWIPKDMCDVELEEDVIWTRVCAFGAPAEHLHKMLEAGATGIEFAKLGVRDNSFHDDATGEDVARNDLVCGKIEDIITDMPKKGRKKASSAL